MLAGAASLGPCQVQSARMVLLVHVKSFAFMPCLPARLWGCATLMSYLPVNEFWLSSGAEDVGGQHWDGRGKARCLVPWLGWDPVLPGCPWPCLFSCFCVLKGSCRVVSCIGTTNRTPLVGSHCLLPGPRQFNGQWHVSTVRTFVSLGYFS